MKWTHCVLAALFAAGMASAGCDKSSENNTKYGAGGPVGFASAGTGSGGGPAVGSGGATGAAGMGTAGTDAPGAGGSGVVTGSGGAGPVTGGAADGGGGVATGSGGMSGGSGGMAAASNEPCPDINIVDFMIMLPGCCDTASNQCGIDGAMFGGTGCTPLAEAQAMAMSMGAAPGTIPDPRPCPAM